MEPKYCGWKVKSRAAACMPSGWWRVPPVQASQISGCSLCHGSLHDALLRSLWVSSEQSVQDLNSASRKYFPGIEISDRQRAHHHRWDGGLDVECSSS